MMLFKLSLKNIKKSIKDYAIYFFTLILGVAIFYIFNSIDSQTAMMKLSESTRDIIKLMNNILSGVSVFVSFILGFLIIYASRFLIKRRNKEFGIYLTLGMSKRKISMILFFETILIGFLSLVVGLGLGIILSQFMSVLVANMFEADLTKFTFVFSLSSFIKTLIYFGIMYLLVMIFNTFQISRCKLIDLLNSKKKNEKVKLKRTTSCIIIFIIASCILGYCYYMVTAGVLKMNDARLILLIMALGSLSTFLIFWSLSGLILKIVMCYKKIYYKGLNSFSLRQISSKINTTIFSMTVICLMLFVTICVLSSSLSMKNSMTTNLKELIPVDIEFIKNRNISFEELNKYGYNEQRSIDSYNSIEESLKKLDFDTDKYLKDTIKAYYYTSDNITLRTTLGSYIEEVKSKYPYLNVDNQEIIMKISDYNKIASFYGNRTYTLKDNEYMIIADFESMVSIRDSALQMNPILSIGDKEYEPKYKECKDGFVNISVSHINEGIILVPDEALTDDMLNKEILLANYKANTKEEKEKIENIVVNMSKHSNAENVLVSANTKIDMYTSSVGLGAIVTFIGLYLGVIFLISSAAILALKELSESTDNKARFHMLRQIGTDEKVINKALFRQIAIFFTFPLLLAIVHSIFGIKFCTYLLETLGKEKMLESVFMTVTFLIIIYGGYFLITYFCSKNIIKEK